MHLLYVILSILFTGVHFTNLEQVGSWGFYPHKLINRHAIFTLPPPMITFYKHHMYFISEEAVAADHRRYVVQEEASRHYIDMDYYELSARISWDLLQQRYPRDSIESHGILPWHLMIVKSQLTNAFIKGDAIKILRISADAGHYIADAHVPLHTTFNYNGQFTGQHGIHGFWETRVPELLHKNFDLWVGRASYRHDWSSFIWDVIFDSHAAVDSVLKLERQLTSSFPPDKKFTYEVRLSRLVKAYSVDFTKQYHKVLDRQVERRLKAAIVAIGDFWYSCWVEAGQPDLNRLTGLDATEHNESQQVADSLWRKEHTNR